MAADEGVGLIDVDAQNWRTVVSVEVAPGQSEFVMPVANYLCLCQYGGVWHPRAIIADGVVVGHVMWAFDSDEGATWLGGLVIDAARQRQGIGRAAVHAFIDEFTSDDGSVHVALSYDPSNEIARALYLDIGFEETGEMTDDGEIVARYVRATVES
jgi:diamine N-acetyltransferase